MPEKNNLLKKQLHKDSVVNQVVKQITDSIIAGNLKPGDGYKYRGRGLIQITGRANYMAYTNSPRCKGDIITHPELLEKPLGAVKSAMWFWKEHGLNELADKDSVLAVTGEINGGTNGLESRKNYLARAKKALNI